MTAPPRPPSAPLGARRGRHAARVWRLGVGPPHLDAGTSLKHGYNFLDAGVEFCQLT
jgi:hypothetical protein